MNVLSEILKNAKSSAVIFGHINRRQKDLKPIFVGSVKNRSVRVYDTASATELLDFHFIKTFYERLNGPGYGFQTSDQLLADNHADYELNAAMRDAGITEKEAFDNQMAASSAWWAVQFGSVRGCEVYDKIVATAQTDQKAA